MHEKYIGSRSTTLSNVISKVKQLPTFRRGVLIPIFLGVLWLSLADEYYASLKRDEIKCVDLLLSATGAEWPQELYSLAPARYNNCRILHREMGILERTFLAPIRFIKD